MDIREYCIEPAKKFRLSDIRTGQSGDFKSKKEAEALLKKNVGRMAELQDMLFAQDKYGVLVIFQAMDTAGKDGAIKHVMSGLNAQGTQVHSFKVPSDEELSHDYMWRASKHLPERGQIGIFNRSYYEEVLVVKVHDLIKNQGIPAEFVSKDIWEKRYRQIREYEQYLYENGYIIIKFFLHISKDEQKKRLLARIEDKSKNWKFSEADIRERAYWDDYQQCYQESISSTTSKHIPWYVIPSDKKWFARLLISAVIVNTLENLKLAYPKVIPEQLDMLQKCRKQLLNE